MADKSAIEWTDASWNPVTGCTKVTPGCDNCYAETFAERFRGTAGHYFEQGFDVVLRPDKLDLPIRWTKPRRVFVNSMSDLFHDQVADEFIARVFAVMALSPQHTFQLLTKRHGRMRSLLNRPEFQKAVAVAAVQMAEAAPGRPYLPEHLVMPPRGRSWWPLPNVWLGVSVEDQQRAELRIPALLDSPGAVRWLSCEPLLGPVNLGWFREQLDWVVVGGESGLNSRPMQVDWARTLRDDCIGADVPFFFKQWGGRTPKANGRELDGRTWNQYPGDQGGTDSETNRPGATS